MNKYYFKDYKPYLYESLAKAKNSILFITPYLLKHDVSELIFNLRSNTKIELTTITNFSANEYVDEKSNIDILEFLLGQPFRNIAAKTYKSVGINSKIIIIDNKEMYVIYPETEGVHTYNDYNLTIHIDDTNEVKKIVNIFEKTKSDENVIDKEDIESMKSIVEEYNKTAVLSCGNQAMYLQNDIDLLRRSIADGIPEEEILTKEMQFDYNEVSNFIESFILDSYEKNSYILQQVKETVENKYSVVSPEEFEAARIEYGNLIQTLKKTFGHLSFKHDKSIEDMAVCFIHSTWTHRYPGLVSNYSKSAKYIYQALGYSVVAMIFAIKTAQFRSFNFDRVSDYSMLKTYMLQHYNYEKALKRINCDRLLINIGSLIRNVYSQMYLELIGFLCWNLDYNQFYYFFNQKLDLTREYVFTNAKELDYKTYFQELAQSKKLHFEYKLVNSYGEDHEKTFEYELFLDGKMVGKGSGHSKKDAQTKSAGEAIKNFLSEYGVHTKISTSRYRLDPYILDSRRKILLEKFAQEAKFSVTDLRFIDMAFTHISALRNDHSLRPNNALSFLGAHLDDACRHMLLLKENEALDESTVNAIQDFKKGINIVKTFIDYYDKTNLIAYTKSLSEITDNMKVSIVQALISVCYIQNGFEDTVSFVASIWKDKLYHKEIRYINELQETVAKKGFKEADIIYEVLEESDFDDANLKNFRIVCKIDSVAYAVGEGSSKKLAREEAAKNTYHMENFKKQYL